MYVFDTFVKVLCLTPFFDSLGVVVFCTTQLREICAITLLFNVKDRVYCLI